MPERALIPDHQASTLLADARADGAAHEPGARAATATFAVDDMPGRDAYRFLNSILIPRPIAWISTVSGEGVTNLAPFSFFNLVTGRPLTVMFASGERQPGAPKDTLANATNTGEFVVNFVDERLAAAMNASSATLAPGVSEFEALGLEAAPSMEVAPPRVAAAPAAIEARVSQVVPVDGSPSTMVLGRVLRLHVREDLLAADGLVDAQRYSPIARLGRSEYARFGEVFSLERPG